MNIFTNLLSLHGYVADPHLFDDDHSPRYASELGNGAASKRFFGSFGQLKDSSRLQAQPQRIRLVTLDRDMTFEEFARKFPSDVDPRVFAAINRVEDPTRTIPAGSQLKRIEGKAAGSQTAGPTPQ